MIVGSGWKVGCRLMVPLCSWFCWNIFSVKSRSTSRTVGTVVLYVFQLPVVYEYESTISTITWEFGYEFARLYTLYCLRPLWLVTGCWKRIHLAHFAGMEFYGVEFTECRVKEPKRTAENKLEGTALIKAGWGTMSRRAGLNY